MTDEPVHTSELLAKALEDARYLDLAARARRHEFHDFMSPHAMPQHTLVALLQRRGKRAQPLIERVKAGDFDATKAESDEWMASEDGKAAFKELAKGGQDG